MRLSRICCVAIPFSRLGSLASSTKHPYATGLSSTTVKVTIRPIDCWTTETIGSVNCDSIHDVLKVHRSSLSLTSHSQHTDAHGTTATFLEL
ncbi:hypothetical protein P692DRAFT_20832534 [Suillus brevipes Sb2]|nr:hypothetical protein P692DRAFT_20832534 [Suillus brevipes Sb2]